MRRIPALILGFSLFAHAADAALPVQEVKAANGAAAWLIEDHTLPIVTVKIAFDRSGSAYDPAGKAGLAAFALQLFDEGAGDLNSLAFNQALEGSAIKVGADTGEDMAVVSLQTLSENRRKALELFALALDHPRFDADAVERIRADIRATLGQMQENPTYLASLHWKEAAFPGHPYASPRRGTTQSVAAITREDLQAYGAKTYGCAEKDVAFVGDISPAEVKAWLESTFPARACARATPPVADVTLPDGRDAAILVKKPVPQTVVEASLPSVKRDDPRYYAVTVLNHILGGDSLTSRLGKEIRDRHGLAYYAESDEEALDHAAWLSLHFATRAAKTNEALKLFREQLALAAKGVRADEVDDAKRYLTGSFPLQIDNEGALADYLLSMQHHHLGRDYLEKRNRLIDAVTPEQVNAEAKALLSHVPLVVMVGNPAP